MRLEMDAAAQDNAARVARLENNVRVLCQNIENSNSIADHAQRGWGWWERIHGGDAASVPPEQQRERELANMGVAPDQDNEERQRDILQQAVPIDPRDHTSRRSIRSQG